MAITRLGGANAISGTLPAANINDTSIGNITALPAAVDVGSLIKISTTTFSGASALEYNQTSLSTDYKVYKLLIQNLKLSDDDVTFAMTFSTDNGSSYLSSSYSRILWTGHAAQSDDAFQSRGGTKNRSSVNVTGAGDNQGNATGEGSSVEMTLFNLRQANSMPYVSLITTFIDATNVLRVNWGALSHTSTTAVDAFRILPQSGTLDSGTATLYGVQQ